MCVLLHFRPGILYVSFTLILGSESRPSPFEENMVAADKVRKLIELLLLLEYIIDQNLVLMEKVFVDTK